MDILFYGEGSFIRDRALKVPGILAEAPGLISPIGAILQSVVPLVELGLDFISGAKSIFGAVGALPGVVKQMATGGIGLLFSQPWKIWQDMMTFFSGDDGVLGQLMKFITNGLSPDPYSRMGSKSSDYWMSSPSSRRRKRGASDEKKDPPKQKKFPFILDNIYGYFEDVAPIGGFLSTIGNGLFGGKKNMIIVVNFAVLTLNFQ